MASIITLFMGFNWFHLRLHKSKSEMWEYMKIEWIKQCTIIMNPNN